MAQQAAQALGQWQVRYNSHSAEVHEASTLGTTGIWADIIGRRDNDDLIALTRIVILFLPPSGRLACWPDGPLFQQNLWASPPFHRLESLLLPGASNQRNPLPNFVNC